MHLIYYTKHSWILRKQKTLSKQSLQEGTFKQAFLSTLTGDKKLSVGKVRFCFTYDTYMCIYKWV